MRLDLIFIGAATLIACGDGTKPKAETETHFLRLCDSTCGAGLSCICGVCTEACTETSACANLNPAATCAPTPDACESAVASACEMTCTDDAECNVLGAGYECADGYCRAGSIEGVAAGQSGAGGAAGSSGQGGNGGTNDPEAYGVTLEASDLTLCPGQCATLQAAVANGVEPLRFTWSGAEASTDTAQVEVCPTTSTTYEVTVTDSRSTLGEFGGADQEDVARIELTVDAECNLPPDEVVASCELQIPYLKGNGIGAYTALESQALMATDAQGNAFLVGSIQGTVDLGDGVSATSAGLADGFVLKLSPSCEPLWFTTFGGVDAIVGFSAVATTADGEIYVTGEFMGTVDFGDGSVTAHEPRGTHEAAVVLKLDADGGLLWHRHYTSAGLSVAALDVGVTDSGDVVFAGYTGTDVDFGGGAIGGDPLSTVGVSYVARLTSDGDHRYSFTPRGAMSHGPIAVHGSGRVAVSGSTGGDVEVAGETIAVNPMQSERFVAVLDDAGGLLHGMALPFAEAPAGGRTYLIDTAGASVVLGADQSMLLDQGVMRVEDGIGGTLPDPQRIVKVDASGTELWTRERAYLGADVVGFYGGLAADSQGNIVHTDEIGPGAMVDGAPIEVAGMHDIYLEKLSPRGELLWSRTFGGPDLDRTWALATAPDDSIWLTYVLSAEYDAMSATVVITKLAPDGSETDTVN
jgi:hypothetical protein